MVNHVEHLSFLQDCIEIFENLSYDSNFLKCGLQFCPPPLCSQLESFVFHLKE